MTNVSRNLLRATMTHVALICDDSTLQPLLPQVLVAKRHLLTKADEARIRATLPANVFLKVNPKGWNNSALTCEILKLMMSSLGDRAFSLQKVIVFDAAKLHLHWVVFRAAARLGVWLLVCPVKLTWLLQPLDTHVFSRYKLQLQSSFKSALLHAPADESHGVTIVKHICKVIRHVLQKHVWKTAFDSDGLSLGQLHVSTSVCRHLAVDQLPVVGNERPSAVQLQLIWPRRMPLYVRSLFMSLDGMAMPLALEEVPAVHQIEASAGRPAGVPSRALQASSVYVWQGRTRSSSHAPPPAAPASLPPAASSGLHPHVEVAAPQAEESCPQSIPMGSPLPGRSSAGRQRQ